MSTTADARVIARAFASRIAAERARRNLTLEEAGKLCGVSRTTIASAERDGNCQLQTALQIANGLNMPIAALFRKPNCARCFDTPPPGFTCRICYKEGPS